MVASGVLYQITDSLTSAAARHILVAGLTDQTRLGQGFARATRSAIPATAGAAGDQEMDTIYYLVAVAPSYLLQAQQ